MSADIPWPDPPHFDGLSTRAKNALRKRGLYTLDQLEPFIYTLEVGTWRGVGMKTIHELGALFDLKPCFVPTPGSNMLRAWEGTDWIIKAAIA